MTRFDVSNRLSEVADFQYEQQGFFGRSVVIAYKDNGPSGANVYIGGSSDPIHINDADPEEFAPSISLIDNNSQLVRGWRLNFENQWEDDQTKQVVVDNMHLDGQYLFGTTRRTKNDKDGEKIFIWRVTLESTNNFV